MDTISLHHGIFCLCHWLGIMAPIIQYFNPILYVSGEREISLQTQIPWLLMTPILYASTIQLIKRHKQ